MAHAPNPQHMFSLLFVGGWLAAFSVLALPPSIMIVQCVRSAVSSRSGLQGISAVHSCMALGATVITVTLFVLTDLHLGVAVVLGIAGCVHDDTRTMRYCCAAVRVTASLGPGSGIYQSLGACTGSP